MASRQTIRNWKPLAVVGLCGLLCASPPRAAAENVWPWGSPLTIQAEDFDSRPIGFRIPNLPHFPSYVPGWDINERGCITHWVQFESNASEPEISVKFTVVARGLIRQPDPDEDPVIPVVAVLVDQRREAFFEAESEVGNDDPPWVSYSAVIPVRPGTRQIGIWLSTDRPRLAHLQIDRIEMCAPHDQPVPVDAAAPPDWFAATVPLPYEDDDAVLQAARDNIEQYRKGDFFVKLVDSAGVPFANEQVTFEMEDHYFKWGTAVQFKKPSEEPLEQQYRDWLGMLFNLATTENVFVWRNYEKTEDDPNVDAIEHYVSLCETRGIELTGHPLVMGIWWAVPEWLGPDHDWEDELQNRIARDCSEFVDELKAYVVVNEPLDWKTWPLRTGPGYVEESFQTARAGDPSAPLLINEFNLVHHDYKCDNYYVLIHELLERNAPIDVVGIQHHDGRWDSPMEQWKCYSRLAQLGRPLRVTEFTLATFTDPNEPPSDCEPWREIYGDTQHGQCWTEALQAEYYGDVLTLAFGFPQIEAFSFWGFADNRIWQPGGGLLKLNEDGTDYVMKPSGWAFYDLVYGEWWTPCLNGQTDSDGVVDTTHTEEGFYGLYKITIGSEGSGNQHVVHVWLTPDDHGDEDNPKVIKVLD